MLPRNQGLLLLAFIAYVIREKGCDELGCGCFQAKRGHSNFNTTCILNIFGTLKLYLYQLANTSLSDSNGKLKNKL
jgi:hypothetical protein